MSQRYLTSRQNQAIYQLSTSYLVHMTGEERKGRRTQGIAFCHHDLGFR